MLITNTCKLYILYSQFDSDTENDNFATAPTVEHQFVSNRVTNRTVIPVNGDYDDGGIGGRGALGTPPTSPITRVSVSVLTQQPPSHATATPHPTTRTPQMAPLSSTNNNNYEEVCFVCICLWATCPNSNGAPLPSKQHKLDQRNTFVCGRVFIGKNLKSNPP
jgi:hypothetical protein